MLHNNTIVLEIPAKVEWTSVAGATASEYAMVCGFSESSAMRIRLAVEESAHYSVGFAYGTSDDTLRMECSQTSLGLCISIYSKGLPLEEHSLPRFDPVRLRREGDMTGLSSFLAQKMVDKAEFSVLGNGERKIVLFKSLPVAEADKETKPQRAHVPHPDPGAVSRHRVRLAVPDDAESISRLALQAHGEVLFNEQIYYPARVREMLTLGEMTSIIAETEEGQLMAHGALVPPCPDAKAEEMTFAFASEGFRGRGIMGEIAHGLVENATSRGVIAVTALAVTNHAKSQRSIMEVGLKESALLLAVSSASRAWRKGDGGPPPRIANLAFIKFLRTVPEGVFHAPDRHKDMIARILGHLGLQGRFSGSAENRLPASPSLTTSLSDCKEGWASILVTRYGSDVSNLVGKQCSFFRAQGVSATQLFLPLDAPETAFMPNVFEEAGFFFAGLGLGTDSRMHLILKRIQDVDAGHEFIRTSSPFAADLVAYVRSCDPNA